jgi:hypothetical protein
LPPSDREIFATARELFSLTVSRPVEESVDEDVMVLGIPLGTTPIIEEPRGGDTIFVKPLVIKDPKRLLLHLP